SFLFCCSDAISDGVSRSEAEDRAGFAFGDRVEVIAMMSFYQSSSKHSPDGAKRNPGYSPPRMTPHSASLHAGYRFFRQPAENRSAEPCAVVRRGEVELRPDRHNAARIHLALAEIIVALDLGEADRLGDAGLLIEVARVVGEVRIFVDV